MLPLAAVGLLWTAPAHASNASVSFDTLRFDASPAETNDVTVAIEAGQYTFTDPGSPITAGPGCSAINLHKVSCSITGIQRVETDLGDLDDKGTLADSAKVPGFGGVTVFGGDGADQLRGGAAVRASLYGEGGADTITAGPLGGSLGGGDGPDALIGGAGEDFIGGGPGDDLQSGGAGSDYFYSESSSDGKDTIDGGAEIDIIDYRSELMASLLTPTALPTTARGVRPGLRGRQRQGERRAGAGHSQRRFADRRPRHQLPQRRRRR